MTSSLVSILAHTNTAGHQRNCSAGFVWLQLYEAQTSGTDENKVQMFVCEARLEETNSSQQPSAQRRREGGLSEHRGYSSDQTGSSMGQSPGLNQRPEVDLQRAVHEQRCEEDSSTWMRQTNEVTQETSAQVRPATGGCTRCWTMGSVYRVCVDISSYLALLYTLARADC